MRTVVITPTLNEAGSVERGSWRIALPVVVWAAALYVAAAASFRVPIPGVPRGRGTSVPPASPRVSRIFFGWDSNFYLSIARSSYEWKDDGGMHSTAFFPLYPLAIRTVSSLTRVDPAGAGELVSFLALLAAALALARLSRREGFESVATIGAMLLFPTAFFFLCVYSESLFLLLAIACLLASREDRPAMAFFFGVLASLARVNGVLLAVPLAWEWWSGGRDSRKLLASMGPVAGLAAVCVFDGVNFGRPLAWLTVQQTGWHHAIAWPWRVLARGILWQPHAYFSVGATIVFCALTILLWARHRPYALWLAANLALFIGSGSMLSTGRHLAPLFPAFWVLGRAAERSRLFRAVYVTAGAVGLLYDAIRFSHGAWVA